MYQWEDIVWDISKITSTAVQNVTNWTEESKKMKAFKNTLFLVYTGYTPKL